MHSLCTTVVIWSQNRNVEASIQSQDVKLARRLPHRSHFHEMLDFLVPTNSFLDANANQSGTIEASEHATVSEFHLALQLSPVLHIYKNTLRL